MLSLDKQEAYRRRYASDHPGWKPATHRYLDMVTRYLPTATRILDVGCGRGGVVEQLRPHVGQFVAIDLDFVSLREHRLPALRRACSPSERLPFPDGIFDIVCSSWVLEHLEHPDIAFAEVARVLAPGGVFIFVTPNRLHPLLTLNRFVGWTQGRLVDRLYGRDQADTFPAFYRANAARTIETLLREAGLEHTAVQMVSDPTYLAFNNALYRLAMLLEYLTPARYRVHIVGQAHKPR
jgi:SAM-dependent methyltransferase